MRLFLTFFCFFSSIHASAQTAIAMDTCSSLFSKTRRLTESLAIDAASRDFSDLEGTREFGRVVDSIIEAGAVTPAHRTKDRIERIWRQSQTTMFGRKTRSIAELEPFLSRWGFSAVQRTDVGSSIGEQLFGTRWVTWKDQFTDKVVEVPESLATGHPSPAMSEEMLNAFVSLLTDSKVVRIRLNQTVHGRYVKTSETGDRRIIIERSP